MSENLDFEQAVQRYVSGQVSAADVKRLSGQLRQDADARQLLIDVLNLDSALAAGFADRGLNVPQSVGPRGDLTSDVALERSLPLSARRVSVTRWVLLAAASVMLMATAFWRLQADRPEFARVRSSAGVAELAEGAVLRSGRYEIAGGTVEVETARGARLVIEAPARFWFESAQRLHLERGRLAADVPATAKGFTVVTPTGEAVDLGTKFGIDVPVGSAAEIHVFQGEVVAHPDRGGTVQSLHDGEALTLNGQASTRRELRSAAFIRPDEFAALHAGLSLRQPARQVDAVNKLRADPALIALFDFESDLPDGQYRMVQGRWPGSRAPEFVSVGDHMTLDVGGDREWPQLTLAAWVRLDRLGDPYQSLLHTDGWDKSNPGQVHWMVTRNATMRLALYGNTLAPGSVERNGYPDSRTSVLPEQGRWMHLATVYDASQRTVRFYLNGQLDSESRQQVAHAARLGASQVGNWNRTDRKLSGRVDELLLLGRAMTDDEVLELFAAGNPYR